MTHPDIRQRIESEEALRDTYGKDCVVRYVITHVREAEPTLRVLTFSAQGRNTYSTPEEARSAMRAYRANGLRNVMSEETLSTVEVRPWLCYPGHHDPCGTVRGED